MIRLLKHQVLTLLLVCTAGGVWGSTMGGKRIPCSYRNLKNPSVNIQGICQVHHGVIGHTGQAYRRVAWPDGVITLIQISTDNSSQQSISAMIDRHPASALMTCGKEIYTIYGNTIELKGNLCQ